MQFIGLLGFLYCGGEGGEAPFTKSEGGGGVGGGLERPDAHRKVQENLRVVLENLFYTQEFYDWKPSCATARVRGLSPLRHRPPFALREGGFAPFTPAIEETQQTDKLQFISP